MNLISYKFQDNTSGSGWDFDKVKFKNINLFVGVSGSGKSRLLNSIFNIGLFVTGGEFRDGVWEIDFQVGEKKYFWKIQLETNNDQKKVAYEQLKLTHPSEKIIFERSKDKSSLLEKDLPKLLEDQSLIYLLKNEDEIKPIFEAFGRIYRRNFFGTDLISACSVSIAPSEIGTKSFNKHIHTLDSINLRLYHFSKCDKEKFETIKNEYKSIFTSIEDISVALSNEFGPGIYPITNIKEKGITRNVPLHELSSGMQKVLMIITDIISLKNESIYIIDEYENSLGVNAINFLPDFLASYGSNHQFIITSHHPYLINSIDIKNWILFKRTGSKVQIRNGEGIEEKYKSSHQEAFFLLINDPAYS